MSSENSSSSKPKLALTLPDLDAQQLVLVQTTVPDMMLSKYLAHHLVEDGIAACANLAPASLSMYMWQGELQGDEEITLTFKTTVARLPELADRLREQHPYELPELIVLPVVGGFTAYLDWVRTQTRPA